MLKRFSAFLFLAVISATSLAITPEKYQEGIDYQLITPPPEVKSSQQTHVIEFFSYGCPVCFRLEPTLEKWLLTKPKEVAFERVPVTFEPGWDIYAKAYYVAEAYKVDGKVTPKIFDAVHLKSQRFTKAEEFKPIFTSAGLSSENFDSGFNYSPTIDAKVTAGGQLMQKYAVMAVPSIIVSGHYKTDLSLAQGDPQRMMDVVSFLIQKSKN